tara:strand:- start:3154 stop:4314 length:1161 start_codon:yes stop_codon:yes gene_type:complete
VKILAISKAAFTSVNRDVYSVLANEYNYEIKLVLPKTLRFAKKIIDCDPYDKDSFDCVALEMIGTNRMSRYKGLFKILKNFKANIIYFEDDPMTLTAAILGIWCYLNNKKFVCRTNQNRNISSISEISRLGYFKGIISITFKIILFWLGKKTVHHIFVISNDGKKAITNLGYKNITKIPLGFNENRFKIDLKKREEKRSELGIDSIAISYFGRITHAKGVHLLIESLSKLRKHNWKFLIDTFDQYADDYQTRIKELIMKNKIEDRTIFFDADHNEISDYMNASDIVVAPSITTPFFKEEYGRVVPESMACGCLVIVSNSGTLKELVNNDEWIFEEGKIDELVLMLERAILMKDRNKFGEEASLYARKDFGIKKQAYLMDNIFKSLS